MFGRCPEIAATILSYITSVLLFWYTGQEASARSSGRSVMLRMHDQSAAHPQLSPLLIECSVYLLFSEHKNVFQYNRL
jgi:hypothetical protein